MSDSPRPAAEPPIVTELRTAGIPDEILTTAARTASRLSAGAGPLDGGTLDPRSSLEYQQLFVSLARKASR